MVWVHSLPPSPQVCAEVGIIPGEVAYEEQNHSTLEEGEGEGGSEGYSVTAMAGNASDTSDDDEGEGQVRRFTSVILDNLQSNIDFWQAKLDAATATGLPNIAVEDVDIEDGDVEDNDHDPDA